MQNKFCVRCTGKKSPGNPKAAVKYISEKLFENGCSSFFMSWERACHAEARKFLSDTKIKMRTDARAL